jgi:MFS family permease
MTADGAAASLMVGIGETYFPAFVLAISSSQLACGLVSTVPMLLGAVLQLCAPWALRQFGSYRRWVVFVAAVQAVGFLPLLAAAVIGAMPMTATFLVIAIYWATGMASGTAWNAWAGTLVPERIRAPYFAGRTRFTQSGIMIGLALGGIILEISTGWGALPEAFALLFLLAAVSRVASACFLSRQRETTGGRPLLPEAGGLIEAIRCNVDSRVLLYMLAAQAACYIASPYFNPYMLGQLHLSYVDYLILLCVPYVAKVACVPVWGRVVDRIGPCRVLWGSGLLIALLPAMWNLSDSFSYLVAVQAYSGLGWAGYELAQLLLFFDTIPTERRVGVLTVYNLFNAAAIFGGSILGGLLLSELGAGRNAYVTLFLVSTIARCAAVGVLARLPAWAARPQSAPTSATSALTALPRLERQLGAVVRVDRPHTQPGRSPAPTSVRHKTPPRPLPTPLGTSAGGGGG